MKSIYEIIWFGQVRSRKSAIFITQECVSIPFSVMTCNMNYHHKLEDFLIDELSKLLSNLCRTLVQNF